MTLLRSSLAHASLLGATLAITGCANMTSSTPVTIAPTPSAAVIAQLAPTGTLRASINFGNPILANRDPAGGPPRGVSVDLAREIGRRLGVPVQLVTFESAGQVTEAISSRRVDVGFLAVDPQRSGRGMAFTAPYVVIEGAYLVRNDSPLRDNAEVDRPGTRIAVGNGSAYDLYLARELKHAKLERAASSPVVTDYFLANKLDVAAGVKQQLEADARRLPGLRLLPGRFMVIGQAMAIPASTDKDREGAQWLSAFAEEMKTGGFVAAALARHNIQGAAVGEANPFWPLTYAAHRSPRNVARDAWRHPAEALAFFGIRPDSTVVEILPGSGGYYMEILAPYLRDRGRYIAANRDAAAPPQYQADHQRLLNRLKAEPALYGKVEVTAFNASLHAIAPPGSADVVMTFRDLHNCMARGEFEGAMRAFHAALKPGGVLAVVDHRARTDLPRDAQLKAGYVRQDEAIAIIEKAGFRFEAASEMNANPKDTKDHPEGVWTLPPTLRMRDVDRAKYLAIGESDRFTLRFVKR